MDGVRTDHAASGNADPEDSYLFFLTCGCEP